MTKRGVPSCERSPRPSRRATLVSPLASSTRHLTPTLNVASAQTMSSAQIVSIPDIKKSHIDASLFSHAQLSWFQAYDTRRFKGCLDFARCDDTLLSALFPSKFNSTNRIPLSHRHTAVEIRQFQQLGNRQQLHLIHQDTARLPPLIPQLKTYPCFGLRSNILFNLSKTKKDSRIS